MYIFQKLFNPTGQKFYSLFNEVAENLKQMGQVYATAAYDNGHMLHTYFSQLETLEEANDMVTHKLFVELGRNFITPFDREDIHFLATGLDDIADYIWASIKLMKNYAIGQGDRTMQQFADQCHKAIKLIATAVQQLKDKKQLSSLALHCMEAKKIVYESDAMIDTAISSLFTAYDGADADTVLLIKKMDHYEVMQTLLEKCGDAINTIESVIIKYG